MAPCSLGMRMLFKEKVENKWFSEFTYSVGEAKPNLKHHTAI